MARPEKKGLDYFNIDCEMEDNVQFVEAKHPHGFKVIIKLWSKIYNQKGYYTEWNERDKLLFADKIKVDIATINAILEDCFNENVFSRKMFKNFGILTSSGVQKRYLKIVGDAKRKNCHIKPDYLINSEETTINSELTRKKLPLIPEETTINSGKSTQSKVKKSKVNEIIYKAFSNLIAEESWVEVILMQTKYSREDFEKHLNNFLLEIFGKEEQDFENKSLRDLKSYFINWNKYNPFEKPANGHSVPVNERLSYSMNLEKKTG